MRNTDAGGGFTRKLNWLVNAALVVAAVAFASVLAQSFFFKKEALPPKTVGQQERLELPGVDWAANGRTLVLALSSECRYCTESAPFYQRVVAGLKGDGGRVRTVAVLPQSVESARRYLKNIEVSPDQVLHADLGRVGFPQTPALALVDGAGVVRELWVGKLKLSRQFAVLELLGIKNNGLAEDQLPTLIDPPTLKAALARKARVTILDAGEREEYRAGHIPGALNIPADEIEARALDELPADDTIVVYCSNNELGERAAEILMDQGFRRVSVLNGSAGEWNGAQSATASK